MQSRPSLIIQYIFLVILIASNHLFSQDIQKIKQSDTVYIYFKKDRITIHNQQKPLEKYIYTFTYFSKDNIYQTLWFRHDDVRFNKIIIK
jgi:hypothetical protein